MLGDKQNIPDLSKLDIKDTPPKTSLLSSSIAAQKQQELSENITSTSIDPIQMPENEKNRAPEEPSLFATSEGDTFTGRLVPSSSNISLFSLNNESIANNDQLPSFMMMPQQQQSQISQSQQSQNYLTTTPFERKSSVTSISSQRHNNALHKQRHQHYMSALTPISSTSSSPFLRKPSNAMEMTGTSNSKTTSPKQIPNNLSTSLSGFSMFPPEPYLEPTSLGGSPSQFYLSSKTPPLSLNNSFFQNYFKQQLQQLQGQQVQLKGIKIQHQELNCNMDRSPDLMPIGTPNDMPPMTPLLLNNGVMEDFRFNTSEGNAIQETN